MDKKQALYYISLLLKVETNPDFVEALQMAIEALRPQEHTNPDIRELAHGLIGEGKVAEGYTLIYLQEIRDLLEEVLSVLKKEG